MLFMDKKISDFKNINEQIAILEEKGIVVKDAWLATSILSSFSFKSILTTCNRVRPLFDDNIEFELIYSIHIDSHDLKQLFLKYILLVENSLKFKMSYVISESYGTKTDITNPLSFDDDDYLSLNHYVGDRRSVVRKLEKSIKDARNSSLSYYRDCRGNIPPWILLENTYFNLTIRWYKTFKNSLKIRVCDAMFLFISESISPSHREEFLIKSLAILRDYRNSFAHSSRRDIISDELPHTASSLILKDTFFNESDYANGIGKNDLSALISILCMLSPDEYIVARLKNDLERFIEKYLGADILPENVSIFDILNLPHDILDRVSNFTRKL